MRYTFSCGNRATWWWRFETILFTSCPWSENKERRISWMDKMVRI